MGSLVTLEHPAGPKFSSVSLYLLPFSRYRSTSCFEGHVTSEIKNGRKCVTLWALNTQRVPNFRPFRSISYRFRDIANFLFSKVIWTWKLKMAENGFPCQLEHPAGPKFSSVSLYLLPFSRYRQLPVSKVTWPRKLKMAENGFPWPFNTQRVPNFHPFRSISYCFRDNANFLFGWSRDFGN